MGSIIPTNFRCPDWSIVSCFSLKLPIAAYNLATVVGPAGYWYHWIAKWTHQPVWPWLCVSTRRRSPRLIISKANRADYLKGPRQQVKVCHQSAFSVTVSYTRLVENSYALSAALIPATGLSTWNGTRRHAKRKPIGAVRGEDHRRWTWHFGGRTGSGWGFNDWLYRQSNTERESGQRMGWRSYCWMTEYLWRFKCNWNGVELVTVRAGNVRV